MRLSIFSHKLHRVSAYVIAIPFLIIIITGILLLLRRDIPFMSGGKPAFKVEKIQKMEWVFSVLDNRFDVAYNDIKTIYLYKSRGVYRVDTKGGKTYNLKADDLTTISIKTKDDGMTLRRFIFLMHEGTILGNFTLYFIYLPSSIFMVLLLFSGCYFLTIRIKKKLQKMR